MVIEFTHTIVTKVTVGRLRRTKNQTSLAKFHWGESCVAEIRSIGRLALRDKIKDSLALVVNIDVLRVYFINRISRDKSRWYDSRIYTTCVEHEKRAEKLHEYSKWDKQVAVVSPERRWSDKHIEVGGRHVDHEPCKDECLWFFTHHETRTPSTHSNVVQSTKFFNRVFHLNIETLF